MSGAATMLMRSHHDQLIAAAELRMQEAFRELARAALRMRCGDCVGAAEMPELYSADLCEDGRTVVELYTLRSGRTGCRTYRAGGAPGAMVYVD